MSDRSPPDPSRRRLLKAAGLVAASSPILSLRRLAYAQAGVTPLRLVCWPMMNGADANKFYPSNMGAMSVISAPIQAYSKYATFIRSINVSGSVNHYAVRSIYSGFPVANYESADPNVKSVDQLIADKIAATAPTPLKSLHLGVIPADSINYYKRAGRSTFFFAPTPVDYEANPVTAFDRVFGGGGGGGAPAPAPGAPDFTADSLNLLDQEMNELSGRLAAIPSELAKLNQHKEALKSLRPSPVSMMPRPAMPGAGGNTLASVEKLRPMLQGNAKDAYKHAYFSDIFDAQVDIMARALVTGHTRVATLQAGSADGNAIVPVDRGYPHHNTSHGNQDIFSRCQAWYFTKMARLLQALDVPDPLAAGKTVLDNTVVVLIAECLPVGHGSNGVPTLLVGGGGGQIKGMGNILAGGGTNKQVMATVLRMFNTDPAHFGTGTIAGVL